MGGLGVDLVSYGSQRLVGKLSEAVSEEGVGTKNDEDGMSIQLPGTTTFNNSPAPSSIPKAPPPPTITQVTADAEIVPSLNSDKKTLTPLENLLSREDFRKRLLLPELSVEEIEILCEDMEKMGRAGNTIPDFASKLGLLMDELENLCSKYPPLHRSMRLAKNHRKKMLGELTLTHAVRNPSAVKELFTNEYFSKDFLSQEEEDEIERLKHSVDKRAEELLLAKGVTPCQYTQVVYVCGDVDKKVYESSVDLREYKELDFLSSIEILKQLEG